MQAQHPTPWQRIRDLLVRLISIADEPGDDDDARLRKRAGVIAGYLTIIAPLSLPFQAKDLPLSWVAALGLSAYSAVNLLVLARSRKFDRYVIALIASGVPFVPIANALGGGVTGGSFGLVWAFLVPGYAILALGPRRATPWFFAFLAMLIGMVAIDPLVRSAIASPPYTQRLIAYLPNVGIPLTITFLLLRYTDLRRRAAEARSEELLTNAIPRAIAARMKHGEDRIAESYPDTTVLFADIVGFTPWAQQTAPDRVLALLDGLFGRFDELAALHGVEKIKTIGDSYMAVAGAPEPRPDHAGDALELARAILVAVTEHRPAGLGLEVRVGLASGDIVAGVIGQRRIQFDIWGDTVNTAARMESSGVPGRIQVAASTWELLRDRHAFERREIEVKGLGPMTTYLFDG
ncbi:MAG: adenylate/guanylate cyclase domain-containing protein [Chloroflexota bacterium]|nr:adenylate/guanylate cyclase domain-containing protein [Chloroflexota bacterium]